MKTKVCNKCKEEKGLEEFSKDKSRKDGMQFRCRACNKAHYQTNREAISAKKKAYYQANRDELSVKSKAHYQTNREAKLAKNREYRRKNRDKLSAQKNKYRKSRYAQDPIFRTMVSLRAQTSRLGNHKSKKTIEIIGISAEEFWRRNGSPTEEQLRDLHIDHIVPLSWFNLENEDHVTVSSHWTNFQYLTTEENLMKGNSYAGTPRAILGTKEEFDIEKHVQDMIEFINATK